MSRVLFQVVHFPKPEHRDDMLAAMDVIREKSAHIDGLDEIGAFEEPDGSRIVARVDLGVGRGDAGRHGRAVRVRRRAPPRPVGDPPLRIRDADPGRLTRSGP